MKFIIVTAITLALFGATMSDSSSDNHFAAPETCANMMTGDWDRCVVTNAGLPETGSYGGGSKILMMMTRATI
jgi:hypothetical protein